MAEPVSTTMTPIPIIIEEHCDETSTPSSAETEHAHEKPSEPMIEGADQSGHESAKKSTESCLSESENLNVADESKATSETLPPDVQPKVSLEASKSNIEGDRDTVEDVAVPAFHQTGAKPKQRHFSGSAVTQSVCDSSSPSVAVSTPKLLSRGTRPPPLLPPSIVFPQGRAFPSGARGRLDKARSVSPSSCGVSSSAQQASKAVVARQFSVPTRFDDVFVFPHPRDMQASGGSGPHSIMGASFSHSSSPKSVNLKSTSASYIGDSKSSLDMLLNPTPPPGGGRSSRSSPSGKSSPGCPIDSVSTTSSGLSPKGVVGVGKGPEVGGRGSNSHLLEASPTPSEQGVMGASRESLFDSASSDRGGLSKTPSPSRSDVSSNSGRKFGIVLPSTTGVKQKVMDTGWFAQSNELRPLIEQFDETWLSIAQ